MPIPPKNNRRAPRNRHDSVMEVYDEAGKAIAWTGKMADFSSGGASFFTTKLLSNGDPVHARVRILEKGVLEIYGHVVWSHKKQNTNQYGIKFDSVKNIHPTGEIKGGPGGFLYY